MGGFGVMDFMIKSSRANRSLLKGGKKSLQKIYQENNLHYIKKRVTEKTREYSEDQKRIFMERFYARQKKVRRKNIIILISVIVFFSIVAVIIFRLF